MKSSFTSLKFTGIERIENEVFAKFRVNGVQFEQFVRLEYLLGAIKVEPHIAFIEALHGFGLMYFGDEESE